MIHSRRIACIATAGAAALALGALGAQSAFGDRDATQSVPTVSVKDDFFSPKTKAVSSGATVKWQWRGESSHDVVFRRVPSGASKRSSTIKTSGTFRRSFSKNGTYRYVCTIHEDDGMKGTVKVQ